MKLNFTGDSLRGCVDHSVELSLPGSEEIDAVSTNSSPSLIGRHSEGIKFPGASALSHKWT